MTGDTPDAETRGFLCDELRVQQFCEALSRGNRRTIGQADIWAAFVAAYCDPPSGPERRQWLLTALEEAARRGAIQLPVRHGRCWDRSSAVVLPTVVRLAVAQPDGAARRRWRQFPWHSRLQWVLQLRTLSTEQTAFLQRIHEGLVEGWFAETECFKYRSLQLTGDEKRLETLLKGVLFGPERLTLEMLGCEADALPLATEFLSPHPVMLVFENAAPFMLARSIAAVTLPPRIGRLAYGAGKQILKAVNYFSMIEPAIQEIRYIGDLDAEGMRIAADLQRRSKLVVVKPAAAFHSLMLESAAALGAADGWPAKDEPSSKVSEGTLSFLAPDIRRRVLTIILASRRIPEEVLSRAAMSELLRLL